MRSGAPANLAPAPMIAIGIADAVPVFIPCLDPAATRQRRHYDTTTSRRVKPSGRSSRPSGSHDLLLPARHASLLAELLLPARQASLLAELLLPARDASLLATPRCSRRLAARGIATSPVHGFREEIGSNMTRRVRLYDALRQELPRGQGGGAESGGRTRMPLRAGDFKSPASTSFAIPARGNDRRTNEDALATGAARASLFGVGVLSRRVGHAVRQGRRERQVLANSRRTFSPFEHLKQGEWRMLSEFALT